MKNIVIHRADSRGFADYGWLKTRYSFSFAKYYNPERMGFGALRVINDDVVDGGRGFDVHPHDNMEIITIPLEGELKHSDSLDNSAVVKAGEIQVMSAGSGVEHSEFNNSKNKPVKLLQIWITPNETDVEPRYDQVKLNSKNRHNKLELIISPKGGGGAMWIHQDARLFMGRLDEDFSIKYKVEGNDVGVYIFVLSGRVSVDGEILTQRDAVGISEVASVEIKTLEDAEVLLFEVPLDV